MTPTTDETFSARKLGARVDSPSNSFEIQSDIPLGAEDPSAAMNIIADHGHIVAHEQKEPPSASWSWWSNLFFLFGSLSYVALSSMAFHIDGQEFSGISPAKTNDQSGNRPQWWDISYYQLVGAMAALWFFGNAVVDLAWALDDRRKNRQARYGGDDPRWDIGLAVTFGVAASCDFFSCVLANYKYTFPSIVFAIAAVHIYLIYALVALSGRTFNFSSSLDQRLTSTGDVLFLLGSIIDVVLSYFLTKAATVDNWRYFDGASMASAFLWTGNAFFCIAADAVADQREKQRTDDPFIIMSSPTDARPEVDLTGRLS